MTKEIECSRDVISSLIPEVGQTQQWIVQQGHGNESTDEGQTRANFKFKLFCPFRVACYNEHGGDCFQFITSLDIYWALSSCVITDYDELGKARPSR